MNRAMQSAISSIPDGRRLHVLDRIYREDLERVGHARQIRVALNRRLRDCAEDGMVAVVESGLDCDGSQYWGRRRVIPATISAYNELEESIAKWADGPFSLSVVRPSETVESGSRDLAMEAFEDGHPHVLYA